MSTSVKNKLEQIEARIAQACLRSGRSRDEIEIIAVTKYVPIARAEEALDEGLRHLGENRWQDAQEKWTAIESDDAYSGNKAPIWHFIGSLQSNKVKDVIGKFTYIHSLDRLSLAEAIDKRAKQLSMKVPCFIQVNVSGEQSKHGLTPDGLFDFVEQLKGFEGITPIGLMTMAPFEAKPEQTRPVFRALRELRDKLQSGNSASNTIKHLSMGMSNDFEVAIEEGATWIRLGTILVGKEEE